MKFLLPEISMPDSFILDENDRALVNALQIAPRASWIEVGEAIGINAATAARRWRRLTDDGIARVVAYPRLRTWAQHRCMALVEVDCEPAHRDQVVSTLIRVPLIASVSAASSGRDLILTVLTQDLAALSGVVLRQLNGTAGIRRTRTHIVTRLFSEGNKWKLGALDARQRDVLARHPAQRVGTGMLAPSDRDLLLALGDGRSTFAELAARTSTSVSTARRRLGRMVRDGVLSFRCETAQPITGWPVAATFWTQVPPNELDRIARDLVHLPEIRMCTAVTGTENLVITLWLRSLSDSQRFEEQLAREFPAIRVSDRTIALRQAKRMGCVLDDTGRTATVIPVDPWDGDAVPA
jgi:DNA-binding Lrp family transcriptional regulator